MKTTAAACLVMALATGAGCATQADDADATGDEVDVTVSATKADGQTQVAVSEGHYKTLRFTTTDTPVDISVYCGISANPDVVGTQFTVTGADLGITAADASPVDSYWQWSGELPAGTHRLRITGVGGSDTCTVSVTSLSAAPGSCTSSTSFHSPETGHTHLRVGTEVPTWGDFPASGNHWGAWATWNKVYDKPVLRGYLLHNLEHGGVVLSYGCSSPDESPACAEAAANLEALKNASGETRLYVTPDPAQTSMYGVRAWRFGMQSDCFDEARLGDFLASTIRHGREDVDANPPVPFDPSTTEVDCHDLMAAPDSCN